MSTNVWRRWGVVAASMAMLVASPRLAHAHAIHTTMTVVTADAGGVTLRIRSFADDFSGAVARYAGRSAPRDSSVLEAEVLRYVRAQFTAASSSGTALQLSSCGITRAKELYWVCVRIDGARSLAGLLLRNRMLTEWHADQVNIVQVEGPKSRRTMLFTKNSAPAAIGAA